MLNIEFTLEKTKMLTDVKLQKVNRKQPIVCKAVFDTGCSITTVADSMFKDLGLPWKDTANVKIIGINGENEGISTVIDYFEIGGVNIGPVRIVVGSLHSIHKDRIIIGMNIILWHNFAVRYDKRMIFMDERKFKNLDMGTRYTRKSIDSSILQNEIFTDEEI
jgi:hypothetical protein